MTQRPDAQAELRATLDELEALRDTIKLQIHLAGMDVRRQWDALDRRLLAAGDSVRAAGAEAEQGLESVTQDVLTDIRKGLLDVRNAISKGGNASPPAR